MRRDGVSFLKDCCCDSGKLLPNSHASDTFAFKAWRANLARKIAARRFHFNKMKNRQDVSIPAVLCNSIVSGVSALRDEFGDEIGAQAFDATLAAVAAFLDATEWRLRRRDRDRVDADHGESRRTTLLLVRERDAACGVVLCLLVMRVDERL